MFPFNNFHDREDYLPSIIQYNIQEDSSFLFSEEDFTHIENNDIFSKKSEKIIYESFGYKENENTNIQTNKFISFNSLDTGNDIAISSLLQRKRNRDNDLENSNNEENEENEVNEVNEVNIENNQQNSNNESKKNESKKHTKYKEDNMTSKLKGYFFNDYVIDLVNQNLVNKKIQLKKLQCKKFIADLKMEKNKALFKMKMLDILCQQKISSKFSKFDEYENKIIIEKIYKEKKEIKVIKILELTFEELFIIFRRKLNDPNDIIKLEEIKDKIEGLDLLEENNKYKDIEYFIQKLYKKNYEDIDDYVKKFKEQCLDYEKWFGKNRGRASRKKIIKTYKLTILKKTNLLINSININ